MLNHNCHNMFKRKSLNNLPNWVVEIGQSTLMGGHKLTTLRNPKAPKALLATKLVDKQSFQAIRLEWQWREIGGLPFGTNGKGSRDVLDDFFLLKKKML
jgi:hypothetical protein